MKKFALLFALLLIMPVFAQESEIAEQPFLLMCQNLQNMSFSFGNINGTNYDNVTEVPQQVLDYVNLRIPDNEDVQAKLEHINNTIFNIEILYNGTVCFNGSVGFNSEGFEFLKLERAEANKSDIFVHADLYPVEELIMEWRNVNNNAESNPMSIVGLFFRTSLGFVSYVFSDDLKVEPILGIPKVFDMFQILF